MPSRSSFSTPMALLVSSNIAVNVFSKDPIDIVDSGATIYATFARNSIPFIHTEVSVKEMSSGSTSRFAVQKRCPDLHSNIAYCSVNSEILSIDIVLPSDLMKLGFSDVHNVKKLIDRVLLVKNFLFRKEKGEFNFNARITLI